MMMSLEERKKHINLHEKCEFRNVKHRQECRGILAYYLDTTLPNKNVGRICHACGNGDCCNPKHMYWGTASENMHDRYLHDPESFKKGGKTNKENGHYEKLIKLRKEKGSYEKLKGNNRLSKEQKEQRLKDIETYVKNKQIVHGGIMRLSEKWNISHTNVRKFLKNNRADLVK